MAVGDRATFGARRISNLVRWAMTTENTHERALTRRTFAGLGIAAGAAAVVGFPEVPVLAEQPSDTPLDVPDSFGATNSLLSYMQIDALAFDTYEPNEPRYFQEATGVQATNSGHYLAAPIPIPSGSTIYQVNISYRSAPFCEIRLRDLVTVTPFTTPFQQSPPTSAS